MSPYVGAGPLLQGGEDGIRERDRLIAAVLVGHDLALDRTLSIQDLKNAEFIVQAGRGRWRRESVLRSFRRGRLVSRAFVMSRWCRACCGWSWSLHTWRPKSPLLDRRWLHRDVNGNDHSRDFWG